uniref:uncharacterized protein LOC105353047 n=1 Tax=Fragaria vesca subsp. vesca TaxID=101020 RepID=UPI0005CB1B4F|nr:PREDICTED: uncharacterized protein LOC105353047 [Fragaria vesca subsp. vesca]
MGIGGIASDVKNARDSPLYVLVREGDSSLWFVIEDGREQQQHQQEEESEKAKIGSDDDIIFRRLGLPKLSYQRFPRSLLVINSKLYMIGGSKSSDRPCRPLREGEIQFLQTEPAREYEYLDFQERTLRWRRQYFGKYHPGCQHLASSKDGLIYGFGPQSYIMNPSRRPRNVVATEPLPRMIGEYAHAPQPLAISNNKIYAYGRAGILPHYLFSYDIEEKRWECLCKHFWGEWATGVVLSGDSYLIAFGSRHPIKGDMERPGLWVFDINRRQWLDEPIEGLDEALPVIPDWVHDEVGYVYVYYLPCLFQVGKDRFALIWEESGNESYKLHCHKFTLQAPASADQPFVARQLSNQVKILNGGNNKILGCTVALETEQGREV